MQPRPASIRGLRPLRVTPLGGLPLLAALLALGAAPARATTMVINSPTTGPMTIDAGDKVNISSWMLPLSSA